MRTLKDIWKDTKEAIQNELNARKENKEYSSLQEEPPREIYSRLAYYEDIEPNYIVWRITCLLTRLKNYLFINALSCVLLGHKWVDNSYGNVDSGYMRYVCKRCGASHGSRLY